MADKAEILGKELLDLLSRLKVQGKHRAWKSLLKGIESIWSNDKLEDFRIRLADLRGELTLRIISLVDTRQQDIQQSLQLLPALRDDISFIKSKIEGTTKTGQLDDLHIRLFELTRTLANAKHFGKILDNLVYTEIKRRESSITCAYSKTYDWALKETKESDSSEARLANWLKSDHNLFWITGLPGSGKSTFMRFIIGNPKTITFLKEWAKGSHLLIARHYFWAAGTTLQKSKEGFLRSILYGVLSQIPSLIPEIVDTTRWNLHRTGIEAFHPWDLRELEGAVQRLITRNTDSLKLCFFIDGLDEAECDHYSLAKSIKQLSSSPNVKICVGSRELNTFKSAFGKDETKVFRLHELTHQDIQTFVEANFQDLRENELMDDFLEEETSKLSWSVCDKAEGVFLWVSLVMESLRRGCENGDLVDQLQERVNQMPVELEKLIDHIFDSIEPQYYGKFKKLVHLCRGSNSSPFLPLPLFAIAHISDGEPTDFGIQARDIPATSQDFDQCYQKSRRQLWAISQGLLTDRILTDFSAERPPFNQLSDGASNFMCSKIEITHKSILEALKNQEICQALDPYPEFDANQIRYYYAQILLAMIKRIDMHMIRTYNNTLRAFFASLERTRLLKVLVNVSEFA